MVNVKCLSCGESFSVPGSLRGGKEKCPSCGLKINIPEGSKPATDTIRSEPDRPNLMKAERPTLTESAMSLFGLLFFVAGLLCFTIAFVLLFSDEYAAHAGGCILFFSGCGVTIMGLPFWAIHHVLRYLRRIANAA